jgi:Galactoside-binding lectin
LNLFSFCVNLIDQSSSHCVFHLDFRFDQNTTVRNCNYGGSWGHEERSHLPVHKGQFFYMEIRAAQDRFLVVSRKLK